MYVSSSSEDTEDTPENVEEFEFNLDWDIEKGNLRNSLSPKLSLFLPEDVGMREDENEEILKKI
jgi:hypothetical protein